MFDDLLIGKIISFCHEARFINRQFMKNYSLIYDGRNEKFKDVITAFYCVLYGKELWIFNFYTLVEFKDFMTTKLETLSDVEKKEFSINANRIVDRALNNYKSVLTDVLCDVCEITATNDLSNAIRMFIDVANTHNSQN